MKHHRILAHGWLLAFSALAFVACGGGGGDSGIGGGIAGIAPPAGASQGAPQAQELANTFAASLTGAQEVPPQSSAANGSGTVVIDPGTRIMNAVLTTSGIAGTTASINQGLRGAVGPIAFTLVETSPGSGIWTGSGTLTDAQLNSLASGEFYFNVPSAASPGGEIRGQILAQPLPAASLAGGQSAVTSTTSFISALRGSQEVPPNGSTATGTGSLLINSSSKQLSVVVATSGIPGVAAHIHQAAPGVSGPIIVPLAETSPGAGIWTATATLTDDQFAALQAGNLYVNVHSTAFPDGEIRGQLIAQQVLSSDATPSAPPASIPPVGAGAPATGAPLLPPPDMNTISDTQPDSASLAM